MAFESVTRSYLVCSTPRSGSTLLCELLAASGVAGRPGEYFETGRSTGLPRQPRQYFEGLDNEELLALLPRVDPGTAETPEAFARRLEDVAERGTGPNGVFGAKLMWTHLLDLGARLRQLPGLEDRRLDDALSGLLPDLRYVQVLRRDKAAQAVSLWKAIQTQQWRHDGAVAGREPVYSFRAIRHLERQLTEQEQAWTGWLAGHAEPIRVTYEDLSDAAADTVAALLDALGMDKSPGAHEAPPPLRRQADARSREWVERYADDLGRAA